MLPERLFDVEVAQGRLLPSFFCEPDLAWLDRALEVTGQHAGALWSELETALRFGSDAPHAPKRVALVCQHLRQLVTERSAPAADPRALRAALFLAAADHPPAAPGDVETLEAATGEAFGLSAREVRRTLFADIESERVVGSLPPLMGAVELSCDLNMRLAQACIARAARVRVRLDSNARAMVQQAHRTGLICLVFAGQDGAMLELSGPLSVLRRTRLYAQAFAQLLPTMQQCTTFSLSADCRVAGENVELQLDRGAPIFGLRTPPRYDSGLEQRFARSFAQRTSQWELEREPAPLRVADTFVFPDFAAVSKTCRDERWLIEILGFWSGDYLRQKAALYRQVAGDRFIFCLHEGRHVDASELPDGARLVRFRRHVDAAAVIAQLTRG